MGLSTGEPAGLQSSGKGLGMAGKEAGRSCCSSCRHLQRETHTLMSNVLADQLKIVCAQDHGNQLSIER